MLVISRAKWLVFLWQQHQLASGSANYFKLMQSCWPGEGRTEDVWLQWLRPFCGIITPRGLSLGP